MLSTIKKENDYDLYTFEGIDLKIRVYSFENDCKVFINYKGYNISSTMMFWDFENECLEYNLTFETAVTKLKNANTLYFIVKKEILNPFIDEIYYFIMENNMENDERKEKVEIDLNTVKTAQELHFLLKKSLDFPDFYGMNWNAFWDTITGLVELPKQLVFIGWNNISKKLPEEAQILKYYLDEYEKNYNKYIECIIEYH